MYSIRLDLFALMKKVAKKLLLFIMTQITTDLIITAIELVSELIIRITNLLAS